VREHPEVLECYTLMGETDFLLPNRFRDIKPRGVLPRSPVRLPGVQSVNSSIAAVTRRRARCSYFDVRVVLRHRCSLIVPALSGDSTMAQRGSQPAPRDRGTAPRATVTESLAAHLRPLPFMANTRVRRPHSAYLPTSPATARMRERHGVEGYARLSVSTRRLTLSTLTNPSTWAACETKRIFCHRVDQSEAPS